MLKLGLLRQKSYVLYVLFCIETVFLKIFLRGIVEEVRDLTENEKKIEIMIENVKNEVLQKKK